MPINLITAIKISHRNNALKAKIGKISNGVDSNVGCFRGSPISAQLFIIYDRIAGNYHNEIRNNHIICNKIIIKTRK